MAALSLHYIVPGMCYYAILNMIKDYIITRIDVYIKVSMGQAH